MPNYFNFMPHNQYSFNAPLPIDLYNAMQQQMLQDCHLCIGSQMFRVELTTIYKSYGLSYQCRVKTPHTLKTLQRWFDSMEVDGSSTLRDSVSQDNDSPLLGLKWLEKN